MVQATNDPKPIFNYEGLTAIAGRLYRHSEDIINAARMDVAHDLALAARMANKFATLKFRILEIAEAALSQDPGATARDLRDAVSTAERDGN